MRAGPDSNGTRPAHPCRLRQRGSAQRPPPGGLAACAHRVDENEGAEEIAERRPLTLYICDTAESSGGGLTDPQWRAAILGGDRAELSIEGGGADTVPAGLADGGSSVRAKPSCLMRHRPGPHPP